MVTNTSKATRTPRILELHSTGLTPREIAGLLSVSTQHVYKVLKPRGLTPNRKP